MSSPYVAVAPTRALRTTALVTRLAVVSSVVLQANAFASGVVPVITTQPSAIVVNAGGAATFKVAATSSTPMTYQWLRDGKAISGATSTSYVVPVAVASDNGAEFMVRITNSIGPAYSWNGQLVVLTRANPPAPKPLPPPPTNPSPGAPTGPTPPPAPVPPPVPVPAPAPIPAPAPAPPQAPVALAPVISTQPKYAVVTAGNTATFSVVATSTSPMTYQWLRNGVAIAGATSTSYTTAATTLSDSGANFAVKITNATGPTWSWSGQLIVNAAKPTPPTPPTAPLPTTPAVSNALPVITGQPQSVVTTGGQPATFSTVAISSGLETYQWSRNGTPVIGAVGSTYTIPSVKLADSGASFMVAITNSVGIVTSAAARLTVNAAQSNGATADRPFSDQSLWNSRPSKFSLGTYQLPAGSYYSTVESTAYSVRVAIAADTDGPVTVHAPAGSTGIWVFDAETRTSQITIPHWPANVQPATGTDGHADIIDVSGNKIHSFFQLRQVQGQWVATDYSWAPLDGSGWGEPGHYNVGARATGVPPTAGLIRSKEFTDGLPAYRHALALSLPVRSLSSSTAYVFPATSSDPIDLLKGSMPEGALLMLPADFDMSKVRDPRLLKIVRTLQSYGAYVVDRNDATGLAIYADIGTNFALMPSTGWDMDIAYQMEAIRAALRQVTDVTEWVDANGAVFTPNHNLNLMSMRGMWFLMQGTTLGTFDSWSQSLVFPDNGQLTVQTNGSGSSMKAILGTVPQAGQTYTISVKATGGATLRLELWNSAGQQVLSTGAMTDGHSGQFQWPPNAGKSFLTATSGAQGGGTVSATLIKVGP